MSIINIVSNPAGVVGISPSLIYILTDDSMATVLTAGYLDNAPNKWGPIFSNTQMALTYTTDGMALLEVVVSGNTISLQAAINPGNVQLPVTANHIAVFVNSTGLIGDDPATAINGGNIQAGLSGTAGYLASFPSAALKGSLRLAAVANTNDTLTTISNAAMGQASVISIPDPGTATANFIISQSAGAATQHIASGSLQVDAGNLIAGTAAGTLGTLISFPGSASTGALVLSAVASAGNFTTTISNASMGQSTVASIPDPGSATVNFIMSKSAGAATQHITTGSLQIDAGNLIAGTSTGSAGTVISFPGTTTTGALVLAAVASAGNFTTTISNASMGQSTVVSIPDPASATAQFVVKASAFVNGNLVQASGTAGLTVDSGVATSALQLKAQVKAATSADIGGAGAGPITISVPGLTAASVVVATVETSTNTVAVAKAVAGVDGFDILFTADPGAACTVNYVAYIAAQ